MPESEEFRIEATATGVSLRIYVAPRASINRIVGAHNGALKIALAAPPVDGAANRALLEFLAKTFGVPKSAVTLASGETSRNKTVLVAGINREAALERIEMVKG